MILKIADFVFNLQENCKIPSKSQSFICSGDSFDISISLSNTDIDNEKYRSSEELSENALAFSSTFRKIADILPFYNTILLHSAVFDIEGTGVAFAAHSGTGKTTHMLLWQQLLGDKMVIVNGDKPIVRFFDNEPNTPYAYGTPWCGKENLGCNMRTPLKHLCFIERSETNYVETLDKKDAIDYIFNQVYMPKDSVALANTINLIDRLISSCRLWKIHCNKDIEAAKVAYSTIFAKENENEIKV